MGYVFIFIFALSLPVSALSADDFVKTVISAIRCESAKDQPKIEIITHRNWDPATGLLYAPEYTSGGKLIVTYNNETFQLPAEQNTDDDFTMKVDTDQSVPQINDVSLSLYQTETVEGDVEARPGKVLAMLKNQDGEVRHVNAAIICRWIKMEVNAKRVR